MVGSTGCNRLCSWQSLRKPNIVYKPKYLQQDKNTIAIFPKILLSYSEIPVVAMNIVSMK
jgi:hypothetical protein